MAWKLIFVASLFISAFRTQVVPQSPCPQYFKYFYEGNKAIGYLQIPPPRDYAEIIIQLDMLVNSRLTTV